MASAATEPADMIIDARPTIIERRQRPLTRRGAHMRLRLLEATVDLISRHGYAATTIQLLADTASVSRGSILHQFPTRMRSICPIRRTRPSSSKASPR
jgi:AcrR family transcriptional regulator